MPILNYTTQISTEKTVMEIQRILSKAGALAIMTQFESGVLIGISFRIATSLGPVNYDLPCDIDAVLKILKGNPRVTRKLACRDQAARVGWRIIKDWVEAQLALVETQMVQLDQVFLPYAKTGDGKTVYQRYLDHGMSGLIQIERK